MTDKQFIKLGETKRKLDIERIKNSIPEFEHFRDFCYQDQKVEYLEMLEALIKFARYLK